MFCTAPATTPLETARFARANDGASLLSLDAHASNSRNLHTHTLCVMLGGALCRPACQTNPQQIL